MSMLSSLLQRAARRRTYTSLLHFDDHMLRDIGLSRGDIRQLIAGQRSASRAVSHE